MRRIHRRPSGVPVLVVAGIAAEPMAAATIALQWDLPSVVVVQHTVDPIRETLVRTVSDVNGVVERVEINVEHACTSCAIREDVVPTLERLAISGKWEVIIAQLPVTAEPMQVCRVIEGFPGTAPHVRIASVIVALDAATLVADLVGDALIAERQLPVRADDPRGVAETTSAFVEYADLITLSGEPDGSGRALVEALARPGVAVEDGLSAVSASVLAAGIHSHPATEDFVSPVSLTPPARATGEVWTLDFRSDRPFHPGRLKGQIADLGGGARRSRGCFWLPSRPHQVCQWDGAGGMLSIGPFDEWDQAPFTRIVVVGTDEGRDELANALTACLVTDEELVSGEPWHVFGDGLEPWLGPVDAPEVL